MRGVADEGNLIAAAPDQLGETVPATGGQRLPVVEAGAAERARESMKRLTAAAARSEVGATPAWFRKMCVREVGNSSRKDAKRFMGCRGAGERIPQCRRTSRSRRGCG